MSRNGRRAIHGSMDGLDPPLAPNRSRSTTPQPPADTSSHYSLLYSLFIGILESKRRRKQLYLIRELLAPLGLGTVWDRLREVQDRQDNAFILTMEIDIHSFACLLDKDFLSNGTEQQSIEMMSIQEQPTVVLVLKGAFSMQLAPSLRKTLMSTGYCNWKRKIRNFREQICM